MYARQGLYHLSHAHSPFCISYFSNRVSFFWLGWPVLQFSLFMPPPHSWDYGYTLPYSQLRWDFATFFQVLEFELRITCLLGKHTTTGARPCLQPFWSLVIFQAGLEFLPWVCLSSWFSYLRPLASWDHRCASLLLLIDWDGDLTNSLPGLALNCDPPDLCHLTRWDYRSALLCLVSESWLFHWLVFLHLSASSWASLFPETQCWN
jgi:hypothetical protein